MEKISLVVPVFNKAATLPLTLKSISKLAEFFSEIIFVDDCSTDSSLNIIKKFSEQHDNVTVIPMAVNVGPYAARIEGISKASSDFVQLLDADDLLHSVGKIPASIDQFSVLYYSTKLNSARTASKHISMVLGWPHPSSVLVNRSFAVQLTEGGRLSWGEDHVFFSQLLTFGPILYMPGNVGEYILHDNTRGNRNASLCERLNCSLRIFQLRRGFIFSSLLLAIFFFSRGVVAWLYKKIY